MNASKTSWFVQRVWPMVRGSIFGRVGRPMLQIERAAAREGDRRLTRVHPPLTYESMAPVLNDSRVGRLTQTAWRYVELAIADSDAVRVMRNARDGCVGGNSALVVRRGATIVIIAAVTHLAMLLLVERYHFPSPSALWLPVSVGVVAAIVAIANEPVSRALADRRTRSR